MYTIISTHILIASKFQRRTAQIVQNLYGCPGDYKRVNVNCYEMSFNWPLITLIPYKDVLTLTSRQLNNS